MNKMNNNYKVMPKTNVELKWLDNIEIFPI